jgi:hypothetical protein
MNKFSNFLVPHEIKNFKKYNQDLITSLMRQDIENMILSQNDNDYFDLVVFKTKHSIKDITIIVDMCKKIQEELHELNWKTKLLYGDTALYVYCKDSKPFTLNWCTNENTETFS